MGVTLGALVLVAGITTGIVCYKRSHDSQTLEIHDTQEGEFVEPKGNEVTYNNLAEVSV